MLVVVASVGLPPLASVRDSSKQWSSTPKLPVTCYFRCDNDTVRSSIRFALGILFWICLKIILITVNSEQRWIYNYSGASLLLLSVIKCFERRKERKWNLENKSVLQYCPVKLNYILRTSGISGTSCIQHHHGNGIPTKAKKKAARKGSSGWAKGDLVTQSNQ